MTPAAVRDAAARRGGVILALDIGATKTLLAVLAADAGELGGHAWLRSQVARSLTERDPEALVRRIADDAWAAAAGRPIVAVGCAVPGPLDRTSGRIVHSPNLGWRDIALGDLLSDRIAAPVAVDDDAAVGALGEARFGAGRGADPFAYLTVSSGVGMGVVVGGRVLHGAHGVAGEVGHLTVDPTGPRCACGRRGDVEAYAGGASLARRARAAWPSGRLESGGPAPRDADGIFRAVRAGDAVADLLVTDAVEALAWAVAAVASVLDPARIAIGGGLALAQPALVRRAAVIARRRTLAEVGRSLHVVPAALRDMSVLAGAAALAADLAERRVP